MPSVERVRRDPLTHWHGIAIALLAGCIVVAAMWWFADAHPFRAAAALVVVYAFGHVTGSLLVGSRGEEAPPAWVVIRLIAGLLLSSIAFLLSLVFSVPWFVGPSGLLVVAVVVGRSGALVWPRLRLAWSTDVLAAGLLAAVLLSPLVISAGRMAPGAFPPVFYNVDTPYFLEKVHGLVRARAYPPESLSNAGVRPLYHFGVQGIAALVSRISGLAPHHSLFLIVVPLLALGILAASIAVAHSLSPALPSAVAVPVLLLAVPSLWYPFWDVVGPTLRDAWSLGTLRPLDTLLSNPELWGPSSIVGHNVAAAFVVLASLAGIAAAPTRGWRLPAFLIGSALIVKAPTGIALVAGFLLAQTYLAITTRRMRPLLPALGAAGVFAAAYVAFFVVPPVPAAFQVTLYPFLQLARLRDGARLLGFAGDMAWLLLPLLIVWPARSQGPRRDSVAILLLGLAPFIVVNLTRSLDIRPGNTGTSDDWLQTLTPVPLLLHAFVLTAISQMWARVGEVRRAVFYALMAVTILPSVFVSGRYSLLLLRHHEDGHELADNRAIGEALATIPLTGTVVVTNDLRYPAEGFRRDDRQMQIPALFGHQAFAVNYAYELYEASSARRDLQMLLEDGTWTDAIADAARIHGWTHLLVRKDYAHADPVPLEQTFENEDYAVYRFGTRGTR